MILEAVTEHLDRNVGIGVLQLPVNRQEDLAHATGAEHALEHKTIPQHRPRGRCLRLQWIQLSDVPGQIAPDCHLVRFIHGHLSRTMGPPVAPDNTGSL